MEFFKTAGALAVVFFLYLSLFVTNVVSAQAQTREKVVLKNIKISGNVRVEDDGIRLQLLERVAQGARAARAVVADAEDVQSHRTLMLAR